MAEEGQSEGQDYTRLHITPLTPALLPTFLPLSVLTIARNISYHTVETFPERAYGFVELPTMEASKLQKKLNGSILKGTKIRIETARPQKLPVPDDNPEPEKPKKDRSKKRKRDETIPAIEIGERSVKRGWTAPSSKTDKRGDKKDKKDKKSKSKYTDGKECLFKTVVPPNKVDLKDGKTKRKKNTREQVVHEFEKTTKHASFLRGSKVDGKSKTASQFVEGKGWVDEDGNLIEEVTVKQKPAAKKEDEVAGDQISDDDTSDSDDSEGIEESAPQTETMEVTEDISEESEVESSEVDTSEAESSVEKANKDVQETPSSSSDSSSEEESESVDSSDSDAESADKSSQQDIETPSQSVGSGPRNPGSRPDSSSGLTITIPPPGKLAPSAADSKSVHPLEALYKRPASTPSSKGQLGVPRPEIPAFSFFGSDQDTAESHDQIPLTPFTQRDFEFRGQRSAAPTPDTAHPNKRFMWPVDNDSDREDDADEEGGTPSGKDKGKGVATASKDVDGDGKEAESDFQKWFYEHRGETNRAWKKRRKVAAKETRQRENRKRADRAA
jgi:hypothetical protein